MAELKRFFLNRLEDVAGVSGCGRVAEGCVFPDGKIALWWYNTGSITIFSSWEHLKQIHCQQDRTKVVWV